VQRPEKGRGKTRVRRTGYTGWDSGSSLLPPGENQRDGCAKTPLRDRPAALGTVGPWGPQKHPSAGPWGASCRHWVTKNARTHLHEGHGLDLVDDRTRWRWRRGSKLWGFWNKSAPRADLRVFQSVGCRALGGVRSGVLGSFMGGLWAEHELDVFSIIVDVFSIVVDVLPPIATYPDLGRRTTGP
jgi:hypothetical protein